MIFDVLGIEYDKSQTFRKGAGKFPHLFWKILSSTETFVNDVELSEKCFFNNIGNINPEHPREIKESCKKIQNFPLVLGGEHTVSYYIFSSLRKKLEINNFICFDAHPDCEKSYGHDGVIRRISSVLGEENVYLIGTRCYSLDEKKFLENSRIRLISDVAQLRRIKGNVYLSVDFDVLDPSIMPCVGNPEPNGMNFSEILNFVHEISHKIVALDFVEFTPFNNELDKIYGTIAVKLILSIIAEIIKK